ncbi:MAG TPA: hypothetical protein VK177_18050 [Flavobacteriales bacterium]|nr:hypothetical protein [Flavobacteriales bacterium]
MFRKTFITLCLVIAGKFATAQTAPGAGLGGAPLSMKLDVKYMGDMTPADAELIKEYLNEFNADKIISADYNLGNAKFTIDHTNLLNEVETLNIFRIHGYEGYFIRDGKVYRLNGTSSGLVITTYDPPED